MGNGDGGRLGPALALLVFLGLAAPGCGHAESNGALIAPGTVGPGAASTPPGRHFESKGGRFAVDFPCSEAPYEHHSEVMRRLQSFECHPAEGVSFEVLYFDDPKNAEVEATFAAEIANAPREIIAVRRHRLQSFPAQTIEVKEPGKDWGGSFMTVLVEGRQYDVNVSGPRVTPADPRIAEFTRSFRIAR